MSGQKVDMFFKMSMMIIKILSLIFDFTFEENMLVNESSCANNEFYVLVDFSFMLCDVQENVVFLEPNL